MPASRYSKNIHLTFPPDMAGDPLVCNLSRLYDLTFNILKAHITPRKEGYMTLQLIGDEDTCARGIAYLAEHQIRVAPVTQRISRDDDSCMHCGMCTAICPNATLHVDRATRLVLFDKERCTACGMCVRVCPVAAMHVEAENGPW